eukprot:scaffold11724_cov124-Isochrysis_galbana.AAC.5
MEPPRATPANMNGKMNPPRKSPKPARILPVAYAEDASLWPNVRQLGDAVDDGLSFVLAPKEGLRHESANHTENYAGEEASQHHHPRPQRPVGRLDSGELRLDKHEDLGIKNANETAQDPDRQADDRAPGRRWRLLVKSPDGHLRKIEEHAKHHVASETGDDSRYKCLVVLDAVAVGHFQRKDGAADGVSEERRQACSHTTESDGEPVGLGQVEEAGDVRGERAPDSNERRLGT